MLDPDRAGVFCDFDGTLSPIVDDPDAATPLPGAVELLNRLATRLRVTAVISGRPLAFLRSQINGDRDHRVILVGLYGLERSQADGSTAVVPEAERWRVTVAQAADDAVVDLPPAVVVERKGLAVTLHVRRHPEQATTAAGWAERAAAATGLSLFRGRMSWELRPPVATDKGTTVEELASGCRAVCYAGDDLGDLPAFDALDRLQASGVHTIKVGVRSREVPAELIERADLVVDGPRGVLAWLRRISSEDHSA